MTRFPQREGASAFEAPMRVEADIAGLEVVQGEVPEHLSGTYYRVVTDRQWPPAVLPDVPTFNDDGMAMYFRFHGGRVDFRSRYVRTPRYEAEAKAGRRSSGPTATRSPTTRPSPGSPAGWVTPTSSTMAGSCTRPRRTARRSCSTR